jgi:hypothetical protein
MFINFPAWFMPRAQGKAKVSGFLTQCWISPLEVCRSRVALNRGEPPAVFAKKISLLRPFRIEVPNPPIICPDRTAKI